MYRCWRWSVMRSSCLASRPAASGSVFIDACLSKIPPTLAEPPLSQLAPLQGESMTDVLDRLDQPILDTAVADDGPPSDHAEATTIVDLTCVALEVAALLLAARLLLLRPSSSRRAARAMAF